MLLAVGVFTFQASAQKRIDSSFPPCFDVMGRPVSVYETEDESNGPAYAMVYQGQPSIFLNSAQLNEIASSKETIKFVFQHECGHCALGHIYANSGIVKTNRQELDADCYAAKQMKRLGIFSNDAIRDMGLFGADLHHPNGILRAANIRRCFLEASNLATGTK